MEVEEEEDVEDGVRLGGDGVEIVEEEVVI